MNEYEITEKRFAEALGPILGPEDGKATARYLLSIVYPALEELQMLRNERGSLGREIYRRIDPNPGEELSEALLRLIGTHEPREERDS